MTRARSWAARFMANWRRPIVITRGVAVMVLVVLTLAYAYGLFAVHRQTHATCVALETAKKPRYEELSRRIRNSRRFEQEHPNGIPDLATADQIRAERNADVHTRSFYTPRRCP